MRRDDVIERLQAHREDVRSFGVESVRLFGSVARGDENTDDVDLLVEFEQPPTFDQYMDLKIYLEDLLGGRRGHRDPGCASRPHPSHRRAGGGPCRVTSVSS